MGGRFPPMEAWPMRTRLVLAVLALLCVSFPATAATPSSIMPTVSCNELGATHMTDDRTGLVICSLDHTGHTEPVVTCASGGGCTWKSMSAASNDGPPGTLCGYAGAEMTGGGPLSVSVSIPCKDQAVVSFNPYSWATVPGCPSGYTFTTLTSHYDPGMTYQPCTECNSVTIPSTASATYTCAKQ
jgi:hypothetical protein